MFSVSDLLFGCSIVRIFSTKFVFTFEEEVGAMVYQPLVGEEGKEAKFMFVALKTQNIL